MTNNGYLKVAEVLTKLMDDQFTIFGIKFGVDPLLDFLPIAGSAIGFIISCYLIFVAWKFELESIQIARMLKNILFDFIIGEIPIIGNITDVFYRANRKNLEILQSNLPSEIIEGTVLQ